MTPPLALRVDGAPATAVPLPHAGLEAGDGVFETVGVRHGEPVRADRHLARLATGLERLALDAPAALGEELAALASVPGAGVVKLVVARAAPGRRAATCVGYAMPPRVRPAAWWADGIELHPCATPYPVEPALAGVKHLSRAALGRARVEAVAAGAAEGVLADVHGRIVCGTMTNVFLALDGRLVTPDLAHGGVAGTVRALLLDAWRGAGRPVEVREVRAAELERAEEIFVTNALIGAWPVRRCGGRTLAPGPWAREAQALAERVA